MTLTLRTINRHAQLMGWGDHWGKTIWSSWTMMESRLDGFTKTPPRWIWSVNTSPFPAPPPNNGLAPTLEDAKQQGLQRHHADRPMGRERRAAGDGNAVGQSSQGVLRRLTKMVHPESHVSAFVAAAQNSKTDRQRRTVASDIADPCLHADLARLCRIPWQR
jgi:hypothetical protein